MPSSPIPQELRVRLADLLVEFEATHGALDPDAAVAALVETAFYAAAAVTPSPHHASGRLHAAIDALCHHSSPSSPQGPPSRPLLVVAVTVLAWATIVFLARRGTLSAWNFVGPAFCTVLALTTVYRHLVDTHRIAPLSFLPRSRSRQPQLPPRLPE